MSIRYRLNRKPFIPNEFGVINIPQPDDYDITDNCLFPNVESIINSFCSNQQLVDNVMICNYDASPEKFILYKAFGSHDKNTITYHFFTLICNRYTDAVFCIRCSKRHKLWVNGILFTVTNPTEQILLVKLNVGENQIVIETGWTREGDNFFLRVSSFEYENNSGENKGLLENSLRDFNDIKFLCYKTNYLIEQKNFRFILFSNNNITFDNKQAVTMELFDADSGEMFQKKTITFGERVEIPLEGLGYDKIDHLNFLRLKLTYGSSTGSPYIIRVPLFLYDITAGIEYVKGKISEMLQSDLADYYDKLCLKYKNDCLGNLSFPGYLDNLLSLQGNIKSILAGNHQSQYIYSFGAKRVFFFSKLDKTVRAYQAFVPKNYVSEKKYPLIVHFSTAALTNYSQYYKNYCGEDVISVDISQRGFTMGSYVGEAAILEALHDVFEKFSIDDSRIYLCGHSNGAYAVWTMLQAYPHLFAGALIVSGTPEYNLICNTSNIPSIIISSQNEIGYASHKKAVGYTRKFKNIDNLVIDAHSHNTLVFYLSSAYYINKLLKNKVNPFPQHIEYTTRMNRHKRGYWVEIHSIQHISKYSKIKVDIEDDNISIITQNITGFDLYIPPYIKKQNLKLRLNGNILPTTNSDDNKVTIINTNGKYTTNIETSRIDPVKKYFGTGLADVFLGELSIIYTLKKLEECANSISTPKTSGINPNISVKYPTNYIDDSTSDLASGNLIILDMNRNIKWLKKIRNTLPINMNKLGYTIANSKYCGDYCIMAITHNPKNNDNSILYINSNSIELMKKNFFLRNFILSAYSSGHHLYLNSNILILDKSGYKIIN